MPYTIKKNADGQFCVYKKGADGEPQGEAHGCHTTEAEAQSQMRALYANVPDASKAALKFVEGSEDEIEGWLMPYGGHLNGRDNSGEWFSAKTDFALSWFTERPLLYHHGLDPDAGIEVVGRIKSIELTDSGGWMRAQLDKAHRYYSAVKKLIEEQALGLSSGAMAHLVKVAKTGHIDCWPVVEGSLTPTPCNLLAQVDFATADKHYKSAGLELPDELAASLGVEASGEQTKSTDIKALAGSFEELRDRLNALINPPSPFNSDGWTYIEATFTDHVIVERQQAGQATWWRIEYSIDDGGTISLGEATQVEETYIPKKSVEAPLTLHAEQTTKLAAALLQRTKDLQERRLKEGRVISTVNRKRLADCADAMESSVATLRALLDSTTPQPAKAAVVWRQLMARNIDSYASQFSPGG